MPDYILQFDDTSMIVEIKQFDAGPTEQLTLRKAIEELDESDAFYQGVPGDRVRSKIDSAMPQLKGLSGGLLPTLLVLYDNVQLWPEICDPYAISVAMHGIETVFVTAEVAPGGGATIVGRWHGPSRKTTPCANTSLSGIALLSEENGRITMQVFHNFFARNTIPPGLLRGEAISHHRVARNPEEVFTEWTLSDL